MLMMVLIGLRKAGVPYNEADYQAFMQLIKNCIVLPWHIGFLDAIQLMTMVQSLANFVCFACCAPCLMCHPGNVV